MIASARQTDRFVVQEPVVPQLVHAIRRRIIRSDMPPGSRLSEAEIAEEFEVSRQPVREAFIVLSNQGLLERRRQRGTYVPKISLRQIRETRFVREAIEADVVRLAVTAMSDGQIADLQRQIDAQQRCTREEAERFMQLDDRFHQSLAGFVAQDQAWQVVEGLKVQMDRVRFLSLKQFPYEVLLEQHKAIVTAIAERNASQAETGMRRHLNNINSDLDVIARNHPDYFRP